MADENKDAAAIYKITSRQIIAAFDQVIDINHQAVWQAIDRYEVRDPVTCFEQVNMLFHYFNNKK